MNSNMPPFDGQSWSDCWDRRTGAGALIREETGPRERTSDLPRQHNPPITKPSENWGGGTNQRFAPIRRPRGRGNRPRGSQSRVPQQYRTRTPPRTQASAASLRERPYNQRNRSYSPRRSPSRPQGASYAHPRGVPSLHGHPRAALPANHPLMEEMAELKATRKKKQLYWAGLIPHLGEEWENPASVDRQQWELEESLADDKFAELAGQIKMAELGMPVEAIGYAQDETVGASTAPLRRLVETKNKATEKPFHPLPDGTYPKRVPEHRRGGGTLHLNQESYSGRGQIGGRTPSPDIRSRPGRDEIGSSRVPQQHVASHLGREQRDRRLSGEDIASKPDRDEIDILVPRQFPESRRGNNPAFRGRRDHFVSKRAKTPTEQEKHSSIRDWTEGIAPARKEKREFSTHTNSGAPPGISPISVQDNYMVDISSDDEPEHSAPANIESEEVRVEPASHEVNGQVEDDTRGEGLTSVMELDTAGLFDQNRAATQDEQDSERSFESFRSLRYSVPDEDMQDQPQDSDEEVEDQQIDSDEMAFEYAEEEREKERLEIGRRMILQGSVGEEERPGLGERMVVQEYAGEQEEFEIGRPNISQDSTGERERLELGERMVLPKSASEEEELELGLRNISQESAGETLKTNAPVVKAEPEDTSIDITQVLRGAVPPNRSTNFGQPRVTSVAIPAFLPQNAHSADASARKADLKDTHTSSEQARLSTHSSSIPAKDQTTLQSSNSRLGNAARDSHYLSLKPFPRNQTTVRSSGSSHTNEATRPHHPSSKPPSKNAASGSTLTSSIAVTDQTPVQSSNSRLGNAARDSHYLSSQPLPKNQTTVRSSGSSNTNVATRSRHPSSKPPSRNAASGSTLTSSIRATDQTPLQSSTSRLGNAAKDPHYLPLKQFPSQTASGVTLSSSNRRATHQTAAQSSHSRLSNAPRRPQYPSSLKASSSTHQTAAQNSPPSPNNVATRRNHRSASPSPSEHSTTTPSDLTSSNLAQLDPYNYVSQPPLSLGYTIVNSQRIEIIDMSTTYEVSSTSSSDEFSSAPSDVSDINASVSGRSWAVVNNVDRSRFFVTGPNRKGEVRHFSYAHQDGFDWSSPAAIGKLNKWRSQVIRRTTGRNARQPGPKYLPLENEFLVAVHRNIRFGAAIDWAAATADFNEEFAGKIIEGSDEPRPARSQGSLVAQRDRIAEVSFPFHYHSGQHGLLISLLATGEADPRYAKCACQGDCGEGEAPQGGEGEGEGHGGGGGGGFGC